MRFLILGFVFLFTGCNHNSDLMTRYHEDGRAKPIVAVASMIDTTSSDLPWSLSEELTSMIAQRISQSGQIFVESQEDIQLAENPFGQDLSWVSEEFNSYEFVIFSELVEHEASPVKEKMHAPPQEVSSNLNTAVRIRVVDLRGREPRIVLQEMVRDSYFIPKTLLPADYTVATWGTEDYRKSPMGIAHVQLVQEIAHRISDYILLAKSR